MKGRRGRIIGPLTTAVGIVVVLIPALLFGLTRTSYSETTVDSVSVMTAMGGLAIVGGGLLALSRNEPDLIPPDGWPLDQHLLDLLDRKQLQVDLAFDYDTDVER